MTLYIVIGTVLFLFAAARLSGVIDRKHEAPLVLYLSLLGYAISFLRWDTGTDWPMYASMYQALTSMKAVKEQSWWGPGYAYLAVLLNSWRAGYSIFLFCIATLLFGVKYQMLMKSCAAPLVAIFVLFCTSFYDIYFVRQDVAVILYWAFAYYLFKRRYLFALLAAFLSVMFHYSAVAPIAITVALTQLQGKKLIVGMFCAAAATYFLVTHINVVALVSLTPLASYFGSDYIEAKSSGVSTTLRAYVKLSYWLLVTIWALTLALRTDGEDESASWSFFCLKSGTGILLLCAALLPISEVFARYPLYAIPMYACVLSNFKFRPAPLSMRGAAYTVFLLLLFVQLGFIYSSFPERFYPVKTVFD